MQLENSAGLVAVAGMAWGTALAQGGVGTTLASV